MDGWPPTPARRGDPEYQDALGHAYYWCDISGHAERLEASQWFRRAALQGDVGGMFMLGSVLIEGRGVLQDYEEGRGWLIRAAAHGEGLAAFT